MAIGPSIADGFYYDVDSEEPLTTEDLEKIEKEMKKIVKRGAADHKIYKTESRGNRIFQEKGEPYKVELIEDLPEDSEISFYQQGEFIDLCAGPHLISTKPVKAFKFTTGRRLLARKREK